MAKVIMVQGTASNVGKSILTAGLCRLFARKGLRVAPFKSQNMALNSFVTEQGLEMGRAQALQAQAAYTTPHVNMNPILLKPTSHTGSQVVVLGEVWQNLSGRDYFARKRELLPVVKQAYEALAAQNDLIIIEGAGSPAEINLKAQDIVNMGMAELVDAPVLLVGDIDRGGVFAHLAGTMLLLEEKEKARIKGFLINKFRGDIEILRPGLEEISQITHRPVLGVIPHLDLDLEDEDSLSTRLMHSQRQEGADVAVIRLPHISNFTDFDPLERVSGISLRYVTKASQLGAPDLIVLPGTKNTMEDLLWLRQTGLESEILRHAHQGGLVFGICGGYQMLGVQLEDPFQVEGGGSMAGMGLLPAKTVFAQQKTRTQVKGQVLPQKGLWAPLSGKKCSGYEIHMGLTTPLGESEPFVAVGERTDGLVAGNVAGCYLHGALDEASMLEGLTELLLGKAQGNLLSQQAHRENELNRLADALEQALDLAAINKIIGLD